MFVLIDELISNSKKENKKTFCCQTSLYNRRYEISLFQPDYIYNRTTNEEIQLFSVWLCFLDFSLRFLNELKKFFHRIFKFYLSLEKLSQSCVFHYHYYKLLYYKSKLSVCISVCIFPNISRNTLRTALKQTNITFCF